MKDASIGMKGNQSPRVEALSESDHSAAILAARARRADYDRYLCALFAPAERRAALFALILFNHEIARTREAVSEPMLGRIRLEWWRETLDRIYRGSVRRHEVAEPLGHAIRAHDLDQRHFLRLIDAREADLEDAPPGDLAALERYAEESAAPLLRLMLEACGLRSETAAEAARPVGMAWALTGLVRAIPHHAAQGRLYLPDDVTAAASLDAASVLRGQYSAPLGEAVAEIARRAADHIANARALRRRLSRTERTALNCATLAEAYLARLRRAENNPFDPSLAMTPLRRQLLLLGSALLGRY